MIRLVIAALAVAALAAGGYVFWATPSTLLVDASGQELTAGTASDPEAELVADEATGLFRGGLYDEALAKLDAGDYGGARDALVPLLESSERDGETCILLSQAHYGLDEPTEAVDFGLKSIELLPECGEAHHAYSRAIGLKMRLGNKLAALPLLPRWREEIRLAVELAPHNRVARLDEIFFYLFVPKLAGGDVEHALELCVALEEVLPIDGRAWRAYGLTHAERADEALALLDEGLLEHPDSRLLHGTRGHVLGKLGRLDEAQDSFAAATAGPEDEEHYRALHGQLAFLVEHELRPEDAVAIAETYIEADPEFPLEPPFSTVWFNKGEALRQLGRTDEARAAYEGCLGVNPKNGDCKDALEALDG